MLSKIFAHLGGGMDCVIVSYAGVTGSSPTEKEQKFAPFSFIHNPPYLHLNKYMSNPHLESTPSYHKR